MNTWEIKRQESELEEIRQNTPIAFHDFKRLSGSRASLGMMQHLLCRLDLETVPPEMRGLYQIQIETARRQKNNAETGNNIYI